jgi:four helix bundle protein
MERFEDIRAWQAARILNRRVYEQTRRAEFMRDHGLVSQIQRASVSVMSNLAEGFERSGLTEFRQYLSIAKGSCAEMRSLLYATFDVGYIDQAEFNAVMANAHDAGRLIGALRKSIDTKVRAVREELPVYLIEPQNSGNAAFAESGVQSENPGCLRNLDEADDEHE